jgi:hypothetical protein
MKYEPSKMYQFKDNKHVKFLLIGREAKNAKCKNYKCDKACKGFLKTIGGYNGLFCGYRMNGVQIYQEVKA